MSGDVFDTTVVIPAHPARGDVSDPGTLLGRAVASVHAGTVQPRAIVIVMDETRAGAAKNRQKALDLALGIGVDPFDHIPTEFVSFLDSDDMWYPNHLKTHRRLLTEGQGGDVAYSWFDGNGIAKQWEATHRGRPFDHEAEQPHHITMTITVRSSFARQATFLGPDMHPDWTGEDYRFILGLRDAGARFVGTGEITWHYAVHGGNTSGSPMRGDAVS